MAAAGFGGTVNMIGDLLSGPTFRCVTIPRVVFRTQNPGSVQPPLLMVGRRSMLEPLESRL